MSYSKCHLTRRAIKGLAPLALLAWSQLVSRYAAQAQKLELSETQR